MDSCVPPHILFYCCRSSNRQTVFKNNATWVDCLGLKIEDQRSAEWFGSQGRGLILAAGSEKYFLSQNSESLHSSNRPHIIEMLKWTELPNRP